MNRDQYELNVLAAVGKLLISELKSLDELFHAIFDARPRSLDAEARVERNNICRE